MTTIRYTMTVDDYCAFWLYRQREQMELARARGKQFGTRTRWIAVLVGCVAAAWVLLLRQLDILRLAMGMLLGVILSGMLMLMYLRLYIRGGGVRKSFARMFEGARNVGVFDARELTLTPEKIIDTTPARRREIEWRAIEKIVTTEDHVFIYDTAVSAFVIPRRDFASDDAFWQFVREARAYHGEPPADAATPVAVPPPPSAFEVIPRASRDA